MEQQTLETLAEAARQPFARTDYSLNPYDPEDGPEELAREIGNNMVYQQENGQN